VPLLATALIATVQWRGALRLLAAGRAGAGPGAARCLLRRAPAATVPCRRQVAAHRCARPAQQAFLWLYLCVLGAPSMFVPFAHASAAARDLGVATCPAVGLVGLIGIGSLTGRFAIGALADRMGRPLTLVLMQASLGASFLLWGMGRRLPGDGAVRAVDGAELRRHRVADAGAVHGLFGAARCRPSSARCTPARRWATCWARWPARRRGVRPHRQLPCR
jgi:hypothetical protein